MADSLRRIVAAIDSVETWIGRQEFSQWRAMKYRSPGLLNNESPANLRLAFDPYDFDLGRVRQYVLTVLQNRDASFGSSRMTTSGRRLEELSGRILYHNLRETTYSCTPEEVTDGFFDTQDIPPWDLWIELNDSCEPLCLLSWVPESLVSLVNRGVEASAEANIYWQKH